MGQLISRSERGQCSRIRLPHRSQDPTDKIANMVNIAGTYKRTKCENWEQFLDKIGTSFMIKKAATISTPTQEVKDLGGGKWSVTTATTLKSMTIEFEFGKPFDEKTTDGRDVTCTVTKESDTKWAIVQKNKKTGGPGVKVTREFSDAGCDMEYEPGGVVSKQFYARQ